MTEARSAPGPWGDVTPALDESHSVELGTLRLVIKRSAGEFWIQARRGVDDPDEWLRWPAPAGRRLEVRPATPDRLLVVSHEYLFHLPPEGEARVFVRIPLFVQLVMTGGATERVVVDLPSTVLSDTWWGTFTEGELAYWHTTTARVALSDDLFLPRLAMCPFRLVNLSEEALSVDRFAVRVPHLSLFSDGRSNWTDEVVVRYTDDPEGSEIRFGGRAPAEASESRLIAHPRSSPERGLRARTFDRLRELSSLGL